MSQRPPASALPPHSPPKSDTLNYARPPKPHRGPLVFTLGILGLVACAFVGPVAWILGSSDLREMDAGRMDPAGRRLTKAGRLCGIISVVLLFLIAIMWSVALATLASEL